MSNSGTTVSVSKCFYLCHPQPVRQQTSLESQRCKVSPVSFLAAIKRKIARDLLPTIREMVLHNGVISHDSLGSLGAKILTQGSRTSQPLYNSKSGCSLKPAGPLSRLHRPYYTASTCQNAQRKTITVFKWSKRGSTGKQTPDGMEEQGGEEEKSSVVCRLHKGSLRKWAEWQGWEGGAR